MPTTILLPAPQNPPIAHLDSSPVLEGVTYTLRFDWSPVDCNTLAGGDTVTSSTDPLFSDPLNPPGSWSLTVRDEPGTTVLMGPTRIVADWPLWKFLISELRNPPGLFYVQDTSGQGLDPGLSDLGVGARCQVLYYSAAEAAALGLP